MSIIRDRLRWLVAGLWPLLGVISANAQFQIVPNRPASLYPATMSTSSVGAIYAQQGVDVRLPGAPPVGSQVPLAVPFFYAPGYYPYGGFYGGFGYGYGFSNFAYPNQRDAIFSPPQDNLAETVGPFRPYPNVQRDPRRPLVAPIEAPNTSTTAEFTLRVPEDAEVWLDGQRMEEPTGDVRVFETPPLEAGRTYEYEVLIRYRVGTETREQKRTLSLQAGDHKSLLILGR